VTSTATATPGTGPIDAATLDALGKLGLQAPAEPQLAAMVAALLGQVEVELLNARVDVHPYPFPALTTRARFVVSGTARGRNGADYPYAFFVKVVQSWACSPLSQHVPEPLRTAVAPLVPWRTELAVRPPPAGPCPAQRVRSPGPPQHSARSGRGRSASSCWSSR